MQLKKLSIIAVAVAAASSQLAMASAQSESNGFVEDSNLVLLNKNYYFNRDFRNNTGGQSYREEWAHGVLATFESGYTQGTVGFGVDAHGALGIKLDSGGGTSGTGLLPTSSEDGRAQDDYSYAGGAVKVRVSNTELKYGNLIPTSPVFATGTARLFPGTATGFQLLSSEIDNLSLDAGHFTAIRDGSRETNSDGEITTAYDGIGFSANSADYLGGTYAFSDNFSATLFGAQLEDVWNQYYANLNYKLPLSDDQALTFDANVYDTSDTGDSKAGDINTTAWSLSAAYSFGAHKLTLAHQQVDGDEPMDYISMDGRNAGDSIWLANSVQYSDFNAPNEKSWQIRYDLDMASFGVPGLTFMARYLTGDDIDGTKADPTGAYTYFGKGGEEWERNLEAKYVVQEGAAKDLSIRVRHSTWRANSAGNAALGNDLDEIRVITEYPLDIL
ncbi:OprD family porin [Pseudomonas oryzae]|uniref:Imipenem/basic amino acid-specific outer membrane pore n=1 Tax=Pseudomonas oryzae TaxID=1392877 RepID=A0A1H1UTV1_9PSED|nr:OprD family porin [Pseudomonas oryzae]SDS76018.1 imipenem/basic amino acid-specific outer membrane pore [Pseudomonas oryzae]